MTLSEMDKRRKSLSQIRDELSKENCHLLRPHVNQIFVEILALDLKRQDPSKELFFEYVKSIETILSCFSRDHNEEIKKTFGRGGGSSYSTPIQNPDFVSQNYNPTMIVQEYIVKLFKKYKDIQGLKSQLVQFFDNQIVNQAYAKHKLSDGE